MGLVFIWPVVVRNRISVVAHFNGEIQSFPLELKKSLFPLHPQVKFLRHQLWLLHGANAAHSLSCHSFLEENIQQAKEHLSDPRLDAPSWLEES